MEFADWKALLTDVGFEVDPATRTSRNDWIVDHRIAPVASIDRDWPVTHIFLVARRPRNT
jgi:hypothetical protein